MQEIEAAGGLFYDESGQAVDALEFFKAQGVNYVRLRLWHTPNAEDGWNDFEHTLEMAKRIKALGLGLLLDFHYSNTWADPAHQAKPTAWENLSFDELTKAVYTYTYDVIRFLRREGVAPDMVQIGNEITSGMLWKEGRVTGEKNWPQLIMLLQAGVRGVREAQEPDNPIEIMLHIDAGGKKDVSEWFFSHIGDEVDFDSIGLSYYPWWQGAFVDLDENIQSLSKRYGKEIIIAETAYP